MSATRPTAKRPPAVSVALQFAARAPGTPAPTKLRRWIRAAASSASDVTLRIVGTAEGRHLNRAFRGRDYATDVLTFVYGRRPYRGDIVICHPVLARAARERGIGLDAHYAHLVVHGMLHLRGHDHERPRDAQRMESLERRILAGLGFDDPYAVESATRNRR